MTLAERIRKRLDVIGRRPADLARYVGVKPPSISKWMNGGTKSVEGENLLRAAEYLQCNPNWLATGRGEELRAEPGNIRTEPRPASIYHDEDEVEEDEFEVMALRLKVSAGNGAIQWVMDDEGKRHRYSRRWAATLNIRFPEKLTTVLVDGDSMEPRIPNGASVTIYTHISSIRSGEVFAVDYLGEFYIKRLYREPDGAIRMTSDSPDKVRYPDRLIAAEHVDSLRVMGVVVDVKFKPVERPWW
ncbi:helix-turn-helix transcriptional regulator [Chitinimonas arctica]|uniref:Helix-turn-helix transcriptional regulator n=1 Tax=Chitinimonas arctica TaxID=2594795 RepID=A0A516SD59_9NEIS|nr:S24 family peptidase [Chitinimonas arctica]QDQ25978.1 helix-turn-helix transcriptional regulator [Chitinimonas arctica]